MSARCPNQMYSLAEISRHHALRVSVISFADQLCFVFCADSDLVPNVQTLAGQTRSIRQGYL